MPNFGVLEKVIALSDGKRNAKEIADIVGCSWPYVCTLIHQNHLPKVKLKKGFALNPRKKKPENEIKVQRIIELADGIRTSKDIANIVGTSAKYVQKIFLKMDLPRLPQGGPQGVLNGSYHGGKSIDLDGYVTVPAPPNHPYAKILPGKNIGRILEHRLVMEKKIGRYLILGEVVDHKDCIHLNNAPENLRLFASNKDHLRATISGQIPRWSKQGYQKMCLAPALRPEIPLIDTYAVRRKRGEIRLQQTLLAWLSLDKDSPYLLGTHRWLEKAGIYDFSHSNLQLHLQKLLQKWNSTHYLSK